MKWHTIFFCTALLLLLACAKNSPAINTNVKTSMQGHLRYSCSCFDGPGLYYVIELSDSARNAPSFSASDSILLIGDDKGNWLNDPTDSMLKYVDVHTVLSGNLTAKKGCTFNQMGGCPLNFKIIDSANFTIIP